MQNSQVSLFARDDTFFGVCEALGQDFGFHPNWLRVALAPLLFLNPVATIGGYLGAGLLIAVTRWFFPHQAEAAPVAAAAEAKPEAVEAEPMPLAA
jgi:phage shock protein PspC (stress-responsive transcriptional regulator)